MPRMRHALPLALWIVLPTTCWAQDAPDAPPNAPYGSEGYADGNFGGDKAAYGAEYLPGQSGSAVQGKIQRADKGSDPCGAPFSGPGPEHPDEAGHNKVMVQSPNRWVDPGTKIHSYGMETAWGQTKRCSTTGFPKASPPAPRPVKKAPVVAPTPGVAANTPKAAAPPPPPVLTGPFSTTVFSGFSHPPMLSAITRNQLDSMTPTQQQKYASSIHGLLVRDPSRPPTENEVQLLMQAATN